ncbi:alkaline phosphatase family protein [Streptacidiphilus sp. MAP12-33]|uniref:alkaline phosphatase family protein n=1 Tax=Streptacidiphilus sp. MAP12-33 TaxID=3156266 RepID=UPI003519ADB8
MSEQLPVLRKRRTLAAAAALSVALVAAGGYQAVALPAPAAASVSAPTLTETTTGPVYKGDTVSFAYAVPASAVSSTNWVGLYAPGAKPGVQSSTSWQYTPAASGSVTFDTSALPAGTYQVYLFADNGYTVLSGPVSLAVNPAPTPKPTPEPPAPKVGPGPNLIVNGDAETGAGTEVGVDTNTVPGWQVSGLLNSVAYGAQGGEGITDYPTATTPGPQHRGHNVFSGGGGGVSTGTQTVSVSAAAHRIDRGDVGYDLTGYLGGSGAISDDSSVTSYFLDAHSKVLGHATLGPVTRQMRGFATELLPEQARGKLPRGTRAIRTVMTVTGPQPHDRLGHAQGYVDNLSLHISAAVPAPKPVKPPVAHVPGYDHVFVVMMENQDYNGIIGNKAAPFVNSLVPKGASLTNAIAETHPSDPNYVALAGGSLFDVNNNTPFQSTVNAPHIGDLVTKAGGSWRGYMENAAGPCDTTAHGAYTVDDLPFYFFKDVKDNPANCKSHLLPLTQLTTDLQKTSTTPTFSWLSADDCDDMEGCGVAAGDIWLKNTLTPILNSPAWKSQRSLIVLTWDEDAADGQQQLERIPTLILGSQGVRPGSTSDLRYTHYSVLRTIEAALHLPSLTKNDLYAQPITGIWQPARKG